MIETPNCLCVCVRATTIDFPLIKYSNTIVFRLSVDSEQSPAVYLRDDPFYGSLQLQQHSELRAPTAERAAFYLDAAIAGRQQRESGDTHMLYTLHVYQYSVAGKGGGIYYLICCTIFSLTAKFTTVIITIIHYKQPVRCLYRRGTVIKSNEKT